MTTSEVHLGKSLSDRPLSVRPGSVYMVCVLRIALRVADQARVHVGGGDDLPDTGLGHQLDPLERVFDGAGAVVHPRH